MAGGFPDVMGLDDANDLADMAVGMGRAVPPKKWVTAFIHQAKADSFLSLM